MIRTAMTAIAGTGAAACALAFKALFFLGSRIGEPPALFDLLDR